MKLTSTAFQHEDQIPVKYTCDGTNTSPPLTISDIPKGTQSLALVLDDPDCPKHIKEDGIWDHWVIFNIPPTTTQIEEGNEPQGVHGIGTGKNTAYYGPCPPDSYHHYYFSVYALDTMLTLEEGATKHQLMQTMKGHILAKAILIGIYGRD